MSIPAGLQDARLGAEFTRDLNSFDLENSKEYSVYFESFPDQKNLKVDVKSDASSRILKSDGYITTRLLIARHGNTFKPGDIVKRVGITDLPLVDSGLLQGKKLGAYLKQKNLIPDVIFTSMLKRAIQTAEQAQSTMQTHLQIEALSIFNEIDYGPDENQPEERVIARVGEEALKAWETKAQVPDGWKVDPIEIIKNWEIFSARLTKDFAGKTILVVTSNGIARFAPYLTGNFTAFTEQYPIKISTGALCVFEKKPSSEAWNCLEWNVKP